MYVITSDNVMFRDKILAVDKSDTVLDTDAVYVSIGICSSFYYIIYYSYYILCIYILWFIISPYVIPDGFLSGDKKLIKSLVSVVYWLS